MNEASCVLVVDASAGALEALEAVLESHFDEVLVAISLEAARAMVDSHRDLSLVLVESVLPDGDGIALVEHVASRDEPKPAVIVTAARPQSGESRRAQKAGALGYLAKPISYPDIARVVKGSWGALPQAAPRIRSRPLGTAFAGDPDVPRDPRREQAPRVVWDIHDLSTTGAFLETKEPLVQGRELHLSLVLDGSVVRVKARVARVQQPSWEHVAGAGVSFVELEADARELLERFLDEQSREG